ncbi:hypothetical protein [Streptomyces sp. NPDC086766]|uniref:hypothetical protein n=1 Tax=Streptomyces sp. NPDC086766 TaxID=3365754 RepID=UPI003806385F
MTKSLGEREQRELTALLDAQTALARARALLAEGEPKPGDTMLLALAYCMLTFGEMLKQTARGVVTPAFSGPIALRDKLAHIPHRKLNPAVLAASIARAEEEILPLIQARITDLGGQ